MIVPEGPEVESYAKNQLAILGNELTTHLFIDYSLQKAHFEYSLTLWHHRHNWKL